jgi:hypothetical protein
MMTLQTVAYAGWNNCLRLTVQDLELIVTTDVGPRIIRAGFQGGNNLFAEIPEQLGKVGGSDWRLYGGHRLWHAPEAEPRTYFPDNQTVAYTWENNVLTLSQPPETTTGITKEIRISWDAASECFRLDHKLTNIGLWPVTLAPWVLSVMNQGGTAIFPQEEFRPHSDYLLPARPLVLWHYTNMNDPRWTWGEKFILLRQEPGNTTKQKVGLLNKQGWCAYVLGSDCFIKYYTAEKGATYADEGCNTETFTNEFMLEVETLAPLQTMEPGQSATHTEQWAIKKTAWSGLIADVEKAIVPLINPK